MTPPQTPKPLTEKELEVAENELHLARQFNYDEETWAKDYGKRLISELKRLRAGHMQAREKILDAIKDARGYVEEANFEDFDKSGFDYCMGSIFDELEKAIKQADAVKDGKNDT